MSRARSERTRVPWFGLTAAPAAWTVQVVVCYAVVGWACFPGDRLLTLPAFDWWRVVVFLVSTGAIAVAAAAGLSGWSRYRALIRQGGLLEEPGEGLDRFLSFTAVVSSAVFLMGIVVNLLAILLVAPCR